MSIVATTQHRPGPGAADPARTALIEIVIPVHNEERELVGCVRVLHAYLNGIPVEEMRWEPLENARILRVPDLATR